MADNINASFDLAGRPDGKNSSIELALSADIGASLPGLKVRVAGIRVGIQLKLMDEKGSFAFTPVIDLPEISGVAVELDLPGADGGGFLEVVDDEWRGAITADLGPVSVGGFAILSTRDFSLLVLLAAEFAVPIQLSFGFTLLGVGGIIGINRRPDIEALQQGLSSGELGNILFPHDAAAEAPRLLPVLSGYFPQEPGALIVGPMAKVGWGTPTLVAASIGVLISTDGIVIVGKVAMTLPYEAVALIRLQASVLGTITADGLDIGASLVDSHIAGMPVYGDLALRIGGGSRGLFVLSAGGFHPDFAPPDGMAGMRRIGTEISPGPFLRARLEAYLAITTSSVQFGARAELSADIAGFGIHGSFGFDALILLDPFGFQADFSACVSVECADFDVASVTMRGHLSGTAPWRIRGHARVEVMGFGGSVDIPELTWGQRSAAALPAARIPADVLGAELGRTENWAAANDAASELVRLRPGADKKSAVHPLAALTFVQNAVPLGIELTRMDSVPLAVPTRLDILDAKGNALTGRTTQFVPAQFMELDDNAKLASAGYAEFVGGFAIDSGPAVKSDKDHVQEIELDPEVGVIESESFSVMAAMKVPAGVELPNMAAPAHEPLVKLRDPGLAVITRVDDLHPAVDEVAARLEFGRETVATMVSHAGVAESLARRAGPADLQLSRAWEVATQ
jgi:hypothetical protein